LGCYHLSNAADGALASGEEEKSGSRAAHTDDRSHHRQHRQAPGCYAQLTAQTIRVPALRHYNAFG